MRTDNVHFSNKVLLVTHTHSPLICLVLTMIFVNIKHIKETRCPGNKFDCYVVFIQFTVLAIACKTSQISIRKRHYRNNIFLQFRRCSKCIASKSILKDSFFESTNTIRNMDYRFGFVDKGT